MPTKRKKKQPKAIGANSTVSAIDATERDQLEPMAVVSVWMDFLAEKPRKRKVLFVDWLKGLGFSTSPKLEGTYKHVYTHPKCNYVVKVTKNGSGNTVPKKKAVQPLFLMPIYMDRHVMIQPKAAISESEQNRAHNQLRKIIDDAHLTSYFADRDFAPCNCGIFEGRPYIIDLSYRRGFEIAT